MTDKLNICIYILDLVKYMRREKETEIYNVKKVGYYNCSDFFKLYKKH